jgi:hypothetical protein
LRVELRYAGLPLIGFLAVHYWFVVEDETGRHRWEIWQTREAGGRSFGHLHCDLKPPEANVGGGPTRVAAEWRGEEARRIAEVLSRCSEEYPFCSRYLAWPGPNSNTFVAWVLEQAGIEQGLGWRALGRKYRRRD